MQSIVVLVDWTENKIVTKRCFQEGDFVMSESKAIAAYIAAKYDKSGRLYPIDPEHRGAIDQRIHFHDGTFNDRLRAFFVHHMNEAGSAPAEEVTRLKEALGWFEDMVRPTGYAAGTQYVTLESNPHSKYIKSMGVALCKVSCCHFWPLLCVIWRHRSKLEQ